MEVNPLVIGEQHASEVVLMLNKSSEHYFSVMNPKKHVFQQEIITNLRAFNGNVPAKSPGEVCSVKSHENIPAQMTDVLKRIGHGVLGFRNEGSTTPLQTDNCS